MQEKLDQITTIIDQSENMSQDRKDKLITLVSELNSELKSPKKESASFNKEFNKNLSFLEEIKSKNPELIASCDTICAMLYQIGI